MLGLGARDGSGAHVDVGPAEAEELAASGPGLARDHDVRIAGEVKDRGVAETSHAKAVAALVRSSGSFGDGDGAGPEGLRGLGRRPAIGDDLLAPPGVRGEDTVVLGTERSA